MDRRFCLSLCCWVACLALCLMVVIPQTAMAQDSYGDPPTRVARLNYIQGEESLQPAGEDDWAWASPNRPLTSYDRVWTGPGSRAEMHIGSNAVRIAPQTSFSFLNLDDDTVQIELNGGTLNVRVRDLDRDDVFEVDTPNIAFSLLQRGDYRITVDPEGGFTTVTVRGGEGQVTGGGQAFYVDPGSQVQVLGTDYITYDIYDLPNPDSFDQWAHARDMRESRSLSARYVSPEMTGYEDLDRDGTWRTVANLGPVWIPSQVGNDWAPYRNGHWAWVEPWGWTWVDAEPFGFVTSHYGRWTSLDNGYGQTAWAWVPPRTDQTTYRRPVYAPALVTFISPSGNDVMWVPLAPGEVYVPPFRASTNYDTRVNMTNTAVSQQAITSAVSHPQQAAPSANQKVANAVTAVPKTAFVTAQPVVTAAVKVDAKTVAAAPAAPAPPLAPEKASVVAGSAPAARPASPPPKPPTAMLSRPVVAKKAPPPPPVAFERKQQALAAAPGKPLDPKVEQDLRASAPARSVVRTVITAPPAQVKPAAELPRKPQPPTSPNIARQEYPAPPAGAPAATAPQLPRAEEAPHQQAAQQQAGRERAQREAALAKQQADQPQAEKEKAQEPPAQRQAETAREPERPRTAQARPPALAQKQPAGRPQANAPAAAPVRIPENVQAAKLVSQPKLNVPANAQNIHGIVRMHVLIGTDGKVKNVDVLGGPPPLHAAAVENVRQRVYQPTMANGVPVEVETEVNVKF